MIGWDFGFLTGRMFEEPLPWSYLDRAGQLLDASSRVLDLGTGGGERLLDLRPHWPASVTATEEWPPNLVLARERLEPLGVKVVEATLNRSALWPFADGSFDLVLNRHSGFNPFEVARILAPGGTFYTQQVDGRTLDDLVAEFGTQHPWPEATLASFGADLEAAGLILAVTAEATTRRSFVDAEALAEFLEAIPWVVEGFDRRTHGAVLDRLNRRARVQGGLVFTDHLYLIEARKGPSVPKRLVAPS